MQAQKRHHQKKKDCPKKDKCDTSFSKTIAIPGNHCKMTDCHTSKSLCCDIKQGNAHKEGKDKCVPQRPVHLKIKPECHRVEAPHFDCNVRVKAQCIEPGTAFVKGGDVFIEQQQIVIDVYEPELEHGKPTYKVNCKAPCQEIAPPKIKYCPGKVNFQCDPDVKIRYHKKCDNGHKKHAQKKRRQY